MPLLPRIGNVVHDEELGAEDSADVAAAELGLGISSSTLMTSAGSDSAAPASAGFEEDGAAADADAGRDEDGPGVAACAPDGAVTKKLVVVDDAVAAVPVGILGSLPSFLPVWATETRTWKMSSIA